MDWRLTAVAAVAVAARLRARRYSVENVEWFRCWYWASGNVCTHYVLLHGSRQSGIWHTRTHTKGVLSEMASCYCYVPLPLTILLQITVARRVRRACRTNCTPSKLNCSSRLYNNKLSSIAVVMPGSVEPKSKAAAAAITRKKTDVTALLARLVYH